MQEQYTPMAAKALKLAKTAAKKLHHNYIGTEHLLLGLLMEGEGVAAQVLTGMQVEEGKILELIENLIAPVQIIDKVQKA